MREGISLQTRRELLQQVIPQYRKAMTVKKKGKLLDAFTATTGYNRKYAMWLLNHTKEVQPAPQRPRPRHYGPEVQHALFLVWHASNRICTKRLIPFLPTLVEALERHEHLHLDSGVPQPTDFQHLQALLDHSIEQAGPFLRESFQMPTHSLSACQLTRLWQASQNIALATVTSKGEPRVTSIGALLFHGQWYTPTVAAALRTRHVLHRPAMSFTWYQGDDLAVIVHGSARILRPDHPDFSPIEAFQQEQMGTSVLKRGEGVFLQVSPQALYTFARYPERYAEQ